eukprot:7346235-Prymnesium_polylepis.1
MRTQFEYTRLKDERECAERLGDDRRYCLLESSPSELDQAGGLTGTAAQQEPPAPKRALATVAEPFASIPGVLSQQPLQEYVIPAQLEDLMAYARSR